MANGKRTIATVLALCMVMTGMVLLANPARAANPFVSLSVINAGTTWDTDAMAATDEGTMGNMAFYTPASDQSGAGMYDVQYYGNTVEPPMAGYCDGTYNNYWNVADQMSAGSTNAECIIIHETINGVNGWAGRSYIGSTNMVLTTGDDFVPSIVLEPIPNMAISSQDNGTNSVTLTWTGLNELYRDEWFSDVSEDWQGTCSNIVNYTLFRSTDDVTFTRVGYSSVQVKGGAVTVTNIAPADTLYYYRLGVNFRYSGNTGANKGHMPYNNLYTWLTAAGITPSASTDGLTGIYTSHGRSQSIPVDFTVGGSWTDAIAPVVAISGTVPNPHNGNTASELVTISGSVTDGPANGDGYAGAARVQIDGAGPWYAATMSATNTTAANTWSLVYNFPSPIATGVHNIAVRAWDNSSNLGTTTGTFTITDSTDPIVAYTGVTPANGGTKAVGAMFVIQASYEDITNFTNNVANTYVRYRINAGAWDTALPTMYSFAWGSYLVGLQRTFTPAAVVGDTVTFETVVDDIGGGAPVALAARTVTITAAGNQVDPYPVWGRVELYNGNAAGVYTPVYPIAVVTIDVTYWNNSAAAYVTFATTSDAAGFYTVDLNTTDLTNVYLHVTAFPGYGNVGDNVTQVDITNFPMGREQKIVCGIPYDVNIITPLDLSVQTIGANVPFQYEILDRSGVRAQGYYDYNDGLFMWLSNMGGFVAPGLQAFDGVTTNMGVANANIVMSAIGTFWFNTTEQDLVIVDPYLTPWNAITYTVQAGTFNNWLRDWDNITLVIQGGGFNWRLYDGWNLVSFPQNAVRRVGANAFLDAQDALAECVADGITDPNLKIATKTNAVVPSTYATYTLGDAELSAFQIQPTLGYWVYVDQAAGLPLLVTFDAVNWVNVTGTIDLNLAANWNLVGFPHDYSALVDWSAGLTASDFTGGVVDADVDGATVLIIATYWDPATQWYQSYVESPTFPGIVARDWSWDLYVNSNNPGVGCWLWSTNAVTLNYNVVAVF